MPWSGLIVTVLGLAMMCEGEPNGLPVAIAGVIVQLLDLLTSELSLPEWLKKD